MLIETLSTFPHMYDSVMGESMMKRAQEKGILEFRAHDLRDWTTTATAPPTTTPTAAAPASS